MNHRRGSCTQTNYGFAVFSSDLQPVKIIIVDKSSDIFLAHIHSEASNSA